MRHLSLTILITGFLIFSYWHISEEVRQRQHKKQIDPAKRQLAVYKFGEILKNHPVAHIRPKGISESAQGDEGRDSIILREAPGGRAEPVVAVYQNARLAILDVRDIPRGEALLLPGRWYYVAYLQGYEVYKGWISERDVIVKE